jgi:hypothetical protein
MYKRMKNVKKLLHEKKTGVRKPENKEVEKNA